MKKINVLVIPSDKTGVGYYRSINPHVSLEELYSDEFKVDIDYEPELENDEFLKKYDIIHYHRTIGPYENVRNVLERTKKLGIVTIMDLDDYWSPGTHHPAYHIIKTYKIDEKILDNIKSAEHVITTTPLFANEISKYNKHVHVLPNAIDGKVKQFSPNPEPSERVRIGWLGGACMTPDTEILTSDGWKRFDMLDQTETVATLNPKTNELEYHKPTGYICEPFDGQLNCAKNGLVEYEVTPNHNMYASVNGSEFNLVQSTNVHGNEFNVMINTTESTLIKTEDQYNRHYKGNVYCVEVQNHIIYVRRNGKPMWIGNSHVEDLKLLTGIVGKLKSEDLLDKTQFVLCGYDLRGTITFIDPKTGNKQQRPIKPHESIWYQYEKIFTDDYKIVSDEYRDFLLTFKEGEYSNVQNEPYRRVWTKPINTYAGNYNLFDVSLAPLVDNQFNKMKSQLKVIEAGFHKKALIAQDFGPYQLDLKHAMTKGSKHDEAQFDPTGNAFLIDKNKNHKDWYKYIKKLIKNPELIGVLGENLYNTVKDTYSINYVTEKRRELYLNLLETKKSVNFVEETEKTI
jgi:glycosyltransferase involved in cell wall biosynthesis